MPVRVRQSEQSFKQPLNQVFNLKQSSIIDCQPCPAGAIAAPRHLLLYPCINSPPCLSERDTRLGRVFQASQRQRTRPRHLTTPISTTTSSHLCQPIARHPGQRSPRSPPQTGKPPGHWVGHGNNNTLPRPGLRLEQSRRHIRRRTFKRIHWSHAPTAGSTAPRARASGAGRAGTAGRCREG